MPCACLDQSNALAFEFWGIIENIQYIRTILCSGAEVYDGNLGVIVSYVNFVGRQNAETCLIAHTKSQLPTL